MRIQETLVTDKQIALELYSENGKYRLPIQGKDYYFPTLEKVHEAFLSQNTFDTIKLTHDGKKSYLHLFMDEIEVFDTKKALRQRLSQDSQGMWAEIRNGKKHYYMEERGWRSTSYKEITEQQCLEKLQRTSTMTKVLGIGLGMLALLPGAVEFARHLPIGTKEAAIGLVALNQKSPVLGAVGYSLLPSKAEAQAVGTEFQVNTYTTSDQSYPCVAPLNNGGFVVVWESYAQDGDAFGIFSQRYDSSGAPSGTEFQVNTQMTSQQLNPTVAPLSDGGFVVTWQSLYQDGDLNGIFGQRYDSSGVAADTEFQVNTYTTDDQSSPSVAPLNDGGFVITWQSDGQDGDGIGIFGQRYDSSAVAVGAEFQVNTYTTNLQQFPNTAPLNDGGFIVTWQSNGQDGNGVGVFGQRYDSSGVAVGAEFQVNTYTTSSQYESSVAPLSNGGFVVTWTSYGQDGDLYGIYGKRYDSSGIAAGAEFQINTYTTNYQQHPSVAPLSDGGFIVTWQSFEQDGYGWGIFGQRYNASGVAIGTEFKVNTYTTSEQQNPSVAPLNDGGFVITWESTSIIWTWSSTSITTFPIGQDGDMSGIFGQRYDASGNPIPLQIGSSTNATSTPSAFPTVPTQIISTSSFLTSQSPTPLTTNMLGSSTAASPTPNTSQGSPSQNTPTRSFMTTQSALTGSTAAPSKTASPTPTVSTSIVPSATAMSAIPSPAPNSSTSAPSNKPSPTPLTTNMLGSSTKSSVESSSTGLDTVSTQSPRTVSMLTSSTISSAAPGSKTQTTISTRSGSKATSTFEATTPTSLVSSIVSVENIVYGESYPILVNDQAVGTYTISGGTGLLDSGNSNVIYFDFDPSFEPEEGQIIALFYVPEEEVALWESIQIEGESYECLEARGQVATNQGRSSYQMVFEDTECLAIAPTMLATALPLTLN